MKPWFTCTGLGLSEYLSVSISTAPHSPPNPPQRIAREKIIPTMDAVWSKVRDFSEKSSPRRAFLLRQRSLASKQPGEVPPLASPQHQSQKQHCTTPGRLQRHSPSLSYCTAWRPSYLALLCCTCPSPGHSQHSKNTTRTRAALCCSPPAISFWNSSTLAVYLEHPLCSGLASLILMTIFILSAYTFTCNKARKDLMITQADLMPSTVHQTAWD